MNLFATYLLALAFAALALFVVGVLAPVAVTVRVVREERVVRLTGRLDVALARERNRVVSRRRRQRNGGELRIKYCLC